MAGGEETDVKNTPTWVVALVCSFIVIISLAFERSLHYLGKFLKRKNQKSLFEALLEIKEELMLLGFISLLLAVFQGMIENICISEELASKWLPCDNYKGIKTTAHFQSFISSHAIGRRLLADASTSEKCIKKGMVPLLSATTLHHLHIFIFILAVTHVTTSALTILFGGAKIRQWKHWEESASKMEYDAVLKTTFTLVREHGFVKNRFWGIEKKDALRGWLHSFFKQFYGSVNEWDYISLRRGFIMNHCKGNPKFNFHKYMMRVLEADFKKVVGVSWYLWLLVVVFLLVNVYGWHAYFWMAFIPFVLLLAVGTKLEHIITQLASEIAHRHTAIEGDLVVKPSDDHFWFHRPSLIIILIHIILFQNSLEIAVFFWIWIQYHFKSCIMGGEDYIIPRLIFMVFIQFLCSYSTLPLYVIVTQMGTSFNKAIFDEPLQEGLVSWAKEAKKNTKVLREADENKETNKVEDPTSMTLELEKVGEKECVTDQSEANVVEIRPQTDFHGHERLK